MTLDTMAILAGGRGTRLLPLTKTIPKALVPVGDEPFINYQLRLLAGQGITRVVICAGHLGDLIAQHIVTDERCGQGLEICFSDDGDMPLGTAGAILKALPMLGKTFGVLYGDTYPLYDLQAVASAFRGTPLMAVRSPGRGNVDYLNGHVWAYGRSRGYDHGDAGFSVFGANTFYTPDFDDLGELFGHLAWYACLDGYKVTEPVYEVGSFEGLSEFREYVLHERVPG